MRVLVLAHTHWDREWYHPVGRFRQRLVALVDELLDAPPRTSDGAVAPFLLDGQAITLEDYLAVRPDRRAALAAALQRGALEAGPWYVLADNLIPEGEALVRNLLAGRRVLAALGAADRAPPVLWAPDAFGHPAALPTLARAAGMRVIVAWRGHGGPHDPPVSTLRWTGADGSSAWLHHLPPDGYEFGSRLPTDADGAARRWAAITAVLAPRDPLGLRVVMNGADHHALQEDWPAAVGALAQAAAPLAVDVVSLGALADAIATRADARDDLPVVHGERRDSRGHAWALQGTFATRAHQKRDAAIVLRRLVRDVEPWLALARLHQTPVGSAPTAARRDAASDRVGDVPAAAALLAAAWQPYLQCLPHDTLCGCSTDVVARAMDARLEDATAQARGLRADAVDALLGHDAVRARAARDAWRPHLVVRNRAARPRAGVALATLDAFVRDVGVGPGSAGGWRVATEPPRHVVPDAEGWRVQRLATARVHDRVESPRHYPDDDLVDRTTALVWVPAEVPPLGLRTVPLRAPAPGASSDTAPEAVRDADAAGARPHESSSARPSSGPRHPVVTGDRTLDNGRVRVEADARGRVTIRWAELDETWPDCLALEQRSDAGDGYTPSLLAPVRDAAWASSVRVTARGPLRGALTLQLSLRVPAALAPATDGHSRPTHPVRRHVELPVTLTVTLDADAAHVGIALTGENLARDHRLRVVVRTPRAGAGADPAVRVLADATFGPVDRTPTPDALVQPDPLGERPLPTMPLHRWVALHDATRAAVLVSDGLADGEAREDGALAVTLVRAVGELSRPDLPERPGHAGWPVATPGAQCPGAFAAHLAVAALRVPAPLPSAPEEAPASRLAPAFEALAEDVLLPLVATTHRALLDAPATVAGVALVGHGLALGAVRPTEADGWVALRCVNLRDAPVTGAWQLPGAVAEVRPATVLETPHEPPASTSLASGGDGRVPLDVGPRGVVTLLVRAARPVG